MLCVFEFGYKFIFLSLQKWAPVLSNDTSDSEFGRLRFLLYIYICIYRMSSEPASWMEKSST